MNEPLTLEENVQLGIYNAERSRGIAHTEEWDARMSELQVRFYATRLPWIGEEGLSMTRQDFNEVHEPPVRWWRWWRR